MCFFLSGVKKQFTINVYASDKPLLIGNWLLTPPPKKKGLFFGGGGHFFDLFLQFLFFCHNKYEAYFMGLETYPGHFSANRPSPATSSIIQKLKKLGKMCILAHFLVFYNFWRMIFFFVLIIFPKITTVSYTCMLLSKKKIIENIMVKKFFYLVSNICHIEKFHIFDKNKQ